MMRLDYKFEVFRYDKLNLLGWLGLLGCLEQMLLKKVFFSVSLLIHTLFYPQVMTQNQNPSIKIESENVVPNLIKQQPQSITL